MAAFPHYHRQCLKYKIGIIGIIFNILFKQIAIYTYKVAGGNEAIHRVKRQTGEREAKGRGINEQVLNDEFI